MSTRFANTKVRDMDDGRHGASTLSTGGLLILAFGTFNLGIDGFVLAGLLPQVASDLGVSVSTAGQLTTLFALTYAISSPVIGALTGRWDRRLLLLVGMVIFLVGVGLQALGPGFTAVAIGRVIAALGAATYQSNAYATAGLLSDDRHRARSLAVVAGGSSIALVAGLPFGILIGQTWGWRGAMWLLVVLAVGSTLLIAALPSVRAPQVCLLRRLSVLGDRRVFMILLGTVSVLVPSFMVIAYVPTILQAHGTWVVLAVLVFGIGQVAGTALVPRLIARRSAPTALRVATIGVSVSAVLLTVSRGQLWLALPALLGIGLSVGHAVVPQQHRVFALVPEVAPAAWDSMARRSMSRVPLGLALAA
jgi:DHA1 family inner membrane transport protein